MPRISAARMPAVTRSLKSEGSTSGIGANDGEHRPPHGLSVHLILDTDEAHAGDGVEAD